jgi:hypothetical protein
MKNDLNTNKFERRARRMFSAFRALPPLETNMLLILQFLNRTSSTHT